MANFRTIGLTMRAQIGDVMFDDVTQFSAAFEMNNIPNAAVTVAVGTHVQTGKAASIHAVFDSMKILLPAKVWLRVVNAAAWGDAPTDLPDGEILIFDGYATGIGWQRTTVSAGCTISLVHWLCDLDYTSTLSGMSHPGNPSDWTYSASFRRIQFAAAGKNTTPTGAESPCWCPMPGGFHAFLPVDLQDIWTNILKPWFIAGATAENIDPIDPRLTGGVMEQGGNAAAVKALQRMVADPPITLNMEGLNEVDKLIVAEGLQWALGHGGWQAWANTTVWGKLIGELAPQLLFTVVPRIENAYIVPFCGGLQTAPFRDIPATSYAQCELGCYLPRVIRGIGLTRPASSQTNADGLHIAGNSADHSGLAGFWPDPPLNEGTIIIKDVPMWLAQSTIPWVHSASTTGNINANPIGLALHPRPHGALPTLPEVQRRPALTEKAMKTLGDRYCHHMYIMEMLKGRVGELSGRLRFDIAPGSQIRVYLGSSHLIAEDQLARPLLGTVMRTSIHINAEAQRAGTAFALAHLHTETENKDARFAAVAPPLYTREFRGATLANI
jgi:hypothetical protein